MAKWSSGPASTSLIYASVIGLSIYTGSILPLMYIGLPAFYGSLAHVHLRPYATCGSGRKRARPSAQLPDGLYERHQPLPLLEHELPRGTPHVPAGALPQPAEAARTGQGGHAQALQRPVGSVARDHSRRFPAGERPHLLYPTRVAHAEHPHRRPGHFAHLHRQGPARRRLGRNLRQQLPAKRRRHPLRPRRQDLRHLPHRRRQSVRHRRHLHPQQRPPGRRLCFRHAHRMRQAQRTLRHHRRFAPASAGLRRA